MNRPTAVIRQDKVRANARVTWQSEANAGSLLSRIINQQRATHLLWLLISPWWSDESDETA
jgi:hypothetical protein